METISTMNTVAPRPPAVFRLRVDRVGFEPREILGLVVRHGLALGLAGGVVGVGAAYAAGRSLESLLFGVNPADPATIATAVGVSIAMTLAGCLVPALRAARTNPTAAMRTE
jgi:ABC-type antimicrobial peptide transport system permease subunit